MIEMYVVLLVALVAAGAGLGILAVIALGIHREEAAHTFRTDIADRDDHAIWVARAVTGLHARSS